MNAVERARLKAGQQVRWNGRYFTYCGYSYKAHTLKENGVSKLNIWPNGHTEPYPVYDIFHEKEY